MIKKLIAILLTLSMFLSLTACADWLDESYDEYDDYENTAGKVTSDTPVVNAQTTSSTSIFSLSSDVVREPQVKLKGNGEDTVTILVYMNGSNLESDDGSATEDLQEMVNAGGSDKVNLIVQTMGTKSWKKNFGIASNRSQTYKVDGNGLTLVRDNLSQLDCTDPNTLAEFISWGAQNYPADRYELILWDHGGGPVYGFGYDEYQDEDAALTLDEMQSALKAAGVYFDFIGFDACIMSCLETCCAFYDYCDYMILSEDFESGIGWYYTDWLKSLYKNTSISTIDLGTKIVDTMVEANQTGSDNEEAILALIDQGMMKVLFTAWTDFAYANKSTLLGSNYSRKVVSRGRSLPRARFSSLFSDWLGDDDEDYSMSDYYITDIMAVASTINSDESAALASAVSQSIKYMNRTSGESGLTGIAVTLPYGDSDFYKSLKSIFNSCGFDSTYVSWLSEFAGVSASDASDFYDYQDFDESWNSWDDYEDDYNWSDWDHANESDDYWDEDFGWDVWDFAESFNHFWDDYDDGEDWYYEDDERGQDHGWFDDDDDYDDDYYDDYYDDGPGWGW